MSLIPDEGLAELERERVFVEELRRGDAEAWKRLVVDQGPYLRRCIRYTLSRYNLPADRLDDIEQKTWLTVYTRIQEFEPRRRNSLRRWMDGIQLNHIRNLAREPQSVSMDGDEGDSGTDDAYLPEHLEDPNAPSPEHQMIDRETRREIWSALDLALQELSPRDREIVLRRVLRREPVEKLAAEYNLKQQTIYQIISNTKKKLRSYLLAPDLFFRVQTGKEFQAWHR
jgi:RNA polymerase sigma factor (sigma-70 family)